LADVQKTVAVIFRGDDEVSKTVNLIAGRMDRFGADLERIAQPMANAANLILKIDAALALLAVGGLVYAHRETVQFENAQVELQKVMGDQPEAIQAASEAALELSNTYGEAAADVLMSTADFKQAGFDAKEAMGLTRDAMDLVIAGSIQASESSEILISALKGFRAPADEARRLMDILNALSNEYAVSVRELGTGMSSLSPILYQMGYNFEEGAALLTPVIEIFRSGDESARALRTGLLRLISDVPKVSEALASIGVSQKDANGELRSGKDILLDVQQAWGGLTDNQQAYITQLLAGKEQAAKMAVVFDTLAYQVEITGRAYDATGSIAGEVNARLQSSEVVLNRLVQGFKNLAIAAGTELKSGVNDTLAGATAIENALQNLVVAGTFDDVFEAVSGFGNDLGRLLREIADILPDAFDQVDFSPLLDALGAAREEIAAYFSDLDLTRPEDLARAVQFAVNALSGLINITAGMVETFRPIIAGIATAIEGFGRLDAEAQQAAGNILAAAKAIVDAGAIVSAALIAIGGHAEGVKRVFEVLIGTVTGFWNTVQTAFDSLVLIVVDTVGNLLQIVEIFNRNLGLGFLHFEEWKNSLIEFRDAANQDRMAQLSEAVDGYSLAWKGLSGQVDEARRGVENIPTERTTRILADTAAAETDMERFKRQWEQAAPEERTTTFRAEPDLPTIERAAQVIEEELPDEKTLKIRTDLDIARIRAQADVVQTALTARVKIDTAELEATTRVFELWGDQVKTTTESTSDSISALAGAFGDVSGWHFYEIFDLIEREQQLQRENFEEQKKLNEAQRRFIDERTRRMQSGDGALIRLEMSGIYPELETIMWNIIERVQLRAAEENAEFLLGI